MSISALTLKHFAYVVELKQPPRACRIVAIGYESLDLNPYIKIPHGNCEIATYYQVSGMEGVYTNKFGTMIYTDLDKAYEVWRKMKEDYVEECKKKIVKLQKEIEYFEQ